MAPVLPRNDLRQYEVLADEWWRPGGAFAMLHWLAAARAALIPPAPRAGAVLVDLGCGAGLLAPHVAPLGYRHVGWDVELYLNDALAHQTMVYFIVSIHVWIPTRMPTAAGQTGRGSGPDLTCSPHSLVSGLSHHQRPARTSSPTLMARVQGAQPIDG